MKLKNVPQILGLFLLLLALGLPRAFAFKHPSLPTSLAELDTIKASLNREPWKSGFAKLAADGHSSLNYVMQGPFATVTRNPDLNLGAWINDMTAVYNLAHMWYFTGNSAYAQKARDILIAWAETQTIMGGNQAGLALGDYAYRYGGGASILRGTWPGWTADDTTKVKNLFLNVYWPGTANPWHLPGPFNKGLINMSAGIAIAVFCDDTAKFNHVVDLYRTSPAAGLFNLLPIGETGETGRDAGHTYGGLVNAAFVSECIWKQGIDVYSDLDDRLLAAGEYYARNTFHLDNPFVDFGTVDALYFTNAAGPYGANRAAFYLIQNAYKNRKGLPTPWIDRKLGEQWLDNDNWLYARTADFSTATPLAPVVRPAVSLASSGLTLTTLGNNSAGRGSSYADGVWTVTGAGTGVSSNTDDCQFAYVQMTGDCAIVAQVTSVQATTATTMAGVMFRDTLSAPVSQRGWMAIMPTSPNEVNSRMNGATEVWAGRIERQTDFPAGSGMPYWVKVERRGNLVTTYSSKDGTSWCPHISDYYGNLGPTAYFGLFVMSGSATATTTATFANVAFTGGTGGLVTTPAAPAAVFAAGSYKDVTVRWLPSFGATGYDLLRSTTSGSGYFVIASDLTDAKTSYVDTTAVAGTAYYYVVQAKNAVGTSGNSPEFGAALLSAPMVNLAFGGTPSASANSGSGYEKSDQAFNLDPGTKWIIPAVTGWLQYDFGSDNAQVVKRYTVSSADVAGRDPKDWQFLGSQDGSTWTTLDTQSGQVFANRVQQNVYNIGNTTAYRYYRINVTANNGDAFALAISELGLWSDSGRTIPDGRYRLVNRHSNKVADVAGGATTDGALLVQSGWNGTDSQQWDIAWQGSGQYRATGVASAKAIDNGGTANTGANLVIQPSNGNTSQLWTITPDSDGFYRIASANSGLVADVSGDSTAAGANLVQSTYTGGDSQLWMPSIGVAPQPIPPVPTGFAVTAASISQINLSWVASPGAVNYRIKRATNSGGPYTTFPAEANTTTWSDTGLTAATTYYYVVSAVNGIGESADSAPANATTFAAPPAAPTGLTVTSGSNRIALSWTTSTGSTSYTVSRATSSGGPYTTVAEGLTGTTYTDTSVANDVTYYYVVSAINAHGSSPGSAEVTISAGTLLAHLKFDESGGAIAPDSSGRGQNATLVSGAGFAAGFLDNALDLPASASQHAKLPSGILSGVTDFTISTWIKVNTFATWQRIFDFGSGTNNYMFLAAQGPAGAGRPRFAIRTPSIGEQRFDSSVALVAGAWTHVAVTRSGTTVRLYINGTLAGSAAINLSPSDLGVTTQNYLGKAQFNDPHLNGRLDDFRLYAYALSADELTAQVHPPAGAPTRLTAIPGHNRATLSWAANGTSSYTVKRSATSGGPYVTLATGLTNTTYTDTGLTDGTTYYYVVGGANAEGSGPDSAELAVIPNPLSFHLKFDESSGTIAADSIRGRNATLVNGPTFAAGAFGNALNLPATAAQHAKLPSGIVSGLTDFTISTWIKVNSFVTWQRIFDFGSGTNNYMFLTAQGPAGAGRPRFAIRTPTVGEQRIDSSIALTPGAWTHLAVTRSGTTVRLYVNGALAGTGTVTLSPSDLGVTTLNYLGKAQFNDPYLNSALDDFRLYDMALSDAEIALHALPLAAPQNVAATPGPLEVNLAWTAVPNATTYTVKYATTSGGPYATLASGLTATSQLHSGLNAGVSYYYVVSASNSLYDGPASDEITGAADKAPASVALGALAYTYDGTPKSTTVTTDPAALAVDLTYNGSDTPPTNAGSYAVTATVVDDNYIGSATGTLTIEKAPASVTLGDLAFTYDGTPKAATATTAPADLAVSFTYDGSPTPPTNAGSYAVIATVTDPNYVGSTSGTLTIAKAPASVTLGTLAFTYDGTAKSTTATTAPAGLTVNIAYDGSAAAPINAGSYAVTATVSDDNYFGSTSGTLMIAKAPATITLAPLAQLYDGTAKTVTATTSPANLTVTLTYDGAADAPIYPGEHPVVATVDDPNYAGTLEETLTIGITALVRHAPTLGGILDGSVQVLSPENIALNGNASLSGDLLVPGTPLLVLNGQPVTAGTREGAGDAAPTNYTVTLNGGSVLRYLVRRVDAIALPTVAAPAAPTGTRSVTLNNDKQSVGDFATLRDLTLNGNAGTVAIPAGAYGSLTANGNSSFVLGVAGATEPAIYDLQSLTLNGTATLKIVGPVILTLANGVQFNSTVGSAEHPTWLALRVAAGGVTLNGNAALHCTVIAPAGTVTVNGNAAIRGTVAADRLVLNGNAMLEELAP